MEDDEKSVLQAFCELNDIDVPETIEDDVISLDIAGVPDIWLLYLGDGLTEIFAQLPGLDANDPGTLRMLLEANYLGLATDEARLSIDPIEGIVVLSERWHYARLLAEDGIEDLSRFAKLVNAWRNDGVATIRAKMLGQDDFDDEDETEPSEMADMVKV